MPRPSPKKTQVLGKDSDSVWEKGTGMGGISYIFSPNF